jgi:hypothetical protein
MEQKILCILPICINPTNNSSNTGLGRTEQYITGLNKFFEFIEILNNYKVDIIIFDNTINKTESLPKNILDVIPDNVKVINDNVNNYGCINKGAGLIECWNYLNSSISQYDFLIHFEPRQLLLNFNFITNFLENPRNLFTYGENNNHFNTGLFCISCKVLITFINSVNLHEMCQKYISIEYILLDFFKKFNIPYCLTDKMELVWFPYLSKPIIN